MARGYYDVLGDGYDILGAVDILGDDYDLLGAAVRRPMVAPRSLPAPRANPVQVAPRQPSESRRLAMGVDSGTAVAAASSATITLTPVDAFRPEVFTVDPVCAPNFLITDIKIGRKSQFLGGNPIPATAFASTSPLSKLQFDTAQQSQPIVITISNTSAAAIRFLGALFGTSVA